MKKNLFTLIEILISLIIIWILVVLLFKIYVTIGNINLKLENEKILQNELMYFNYFITQIFDKTNIDYSKYSNLNITNWLTWKLYLSWNWYNISIYQTWNCMLTDWKEIKYKNCRIEANIDWKKYVLTNTWKVYITNLTFKIIPFEKNPTTFSWVYNQWFWISFIMYPKNYNPYYRPTNLKINFTNYFNKQ